MRLRTPVTKIDRRQTSADAAVYVASVVVIAIGIFLLLGTVLARVASIFNLG